MSRIVRYVSDNSQSTNGCCIELDSKEKILIFFKEDIVNRELLICKVLSGRFPIATAYKTIITMSLEKKLETKLYKELSVHLKEKVDWLERPCPKNPVSGEFQTPNSLEAFSILEKIVNKILPFKSTKDIIEAYYNK